MVLNFVYTNSGPGHMVRYEPVNANYHSWVFSSNGDFVHGQWSQIATRDWSGKLAGQTIDGKRKTASSTYTFVDGDSYIYRLTDQQVGGEAMPDVEWDFNRVR